MTDRLPEEQRRGITIELGFAPWRISEDLLVSVIDAPGHRKLVHHMIAGASGIDIVLLVVAADEGPMPQTHEHIAACKLLGVRRAVIAVTKIDRMQGGDRELAEIAAEEARELVESFGISAVTVLCSGKTGEGVDAVKAAVLAAIDDAGLGADRRGRVRLSVDRVFPVPGAGAVVTGTLVEGELSVGSELRILGPSRELRATARGLHVHGESRGRAAAPTRLAINLGGVSHEALARGDVLTDDPHALPTRVIDVWLQALEPMKRGSEATLFIGTSSCAAKIQPVEKTDVLTSGGLARLRLAAPIVALGGDRFVLRGARIESRKGAVIGGGVVLDTRPPKARAAKRAALLAALHREDAAAAVRALVEERAPRALMKRDLPARFSIDAAALVAAAGGDAALLPVGDQGWVTRAAVEASEERALALVEAHHRAAPLDPGMVLQTLRERLAESCGPEATDVVLARLTSGDAPRLLVDGSAVRLPSFAGAAADPRAQKALDDAKRILSDAALSGASENAISTQLGDAKMVKALLAKLVREDVAVHTGGLYFDRQAVDALRGRIVAHLEAKGRLTIAELKDMTGLGRKQSIPLLEYFDRERVTKRDGSDRVKGSAI